MLLPHPDSEIIDAQTGKLLKNWEIREKMGKFEKILAGNSKRPVFIDICRSIDAVLAVLTCLQLGVPFTFCREIENCRIFDGEQVRSTEKEGNLNFEEEICYFITTSGTTGQKKHVAVPWDCIWRNVDDFCETFSITSTDRILFSTSLRFDPSIIELFMAFKSGAVLILTPDEFRSTPYLLQKAIEQFRPSFVQLTPTVFEMLPAPAEILKIARILIIGGAHFPRSFQNSDSKCRVFNVYGVTEVSCWATIFEIGGNLKIEIGRPIGGSVLEVDEETGELVIGGPRQCYINGTKSDKHKTGDLVERTETGGFRIIGRIDRMIKHRGVRLSLDHLESIQHPQCVHYVHVKERDLLVEFRQVSASEQEQNSTWKRVKIDNHTVIGVLECHVANFPINSSGKIDERKLVENLKFPEIGLEEFLKKRLQIDNFGRKTFAELGMTSLLAVEISSQFFREPDTQNEALRLILDGKTPVADFLRRFEHQFQNQKSEKDAEIVHVALRPQPRLKWAADLKKCVDGNLLLIGNDIVVVAAHSGVVAAFHVASGDVIWRTHCEARFEAAPVLVNDQVVVGNRNRDGPGLVFISLETGEILELAPFQVRASVNFDGQYVYCTCENGELNVLDPKTYQLVYTQKIGKTRGGSSIRPVFDGNGGVYAVLTNGAMVKIQKSPDHKFCATWQQELGPTFAEPVFLENSRMIVVLNVHGVVRILNAENGQVTNSIELKEQCFCAPLIIDNNRQLLIATNSGKVVVLNLNVKLEILRIFQFDLPGACFVRTPRLMHFNFHDGNFWIMSKNGWLVTWNRDAAVACATRLSAKEVFTTPVLVGGVLLVAGRDDYLRAYKF